MNALAKSRLGRVLLHAYCLFRNPLHFRWHSAGIWRELSGRSLRLTNPHSA